MKTFIVLYINLLIIFSTAFSQPPRITITNPTRLNSNNNTAEIVLNTDVCWVNNTASSNIYLTNVTVRFRGAGLQYIGGSQSTPFHNLRIAKTGSGAQLDVYLDQNISISNQLYMESGYFDLRNFNVTLGATATLQNEAANRRVKATNRPNYSTAGSEGFGTGYLITTRTNPSGNVANLGLDFTPSGGGLGSTEILRGHERLQGSGSFTGNYSVYRYYRLNPTTMRQLTINNFYYFVDGANPAAGVAELHSHPEANLQMFQRVQYWNGSTNPIFWEPRSSSVNTAGDFVSSTTTPNAIMLNYILITLGSTTIPLPVEYLTFNGFCNEGKNTIYWQTASENNNYGFIVEKSNDAQQWTYLTFLPGQGTVNSVSSYQIEDKQPFLLTYYRLKQLDNDGSIEYSNIISVNCNDVLLTEDFYTVYPSYDIVVQGIPGNEYQIIFTNVLGQQLLYKKFVLSAPQETFKFFDHLKTTGVYYVSLISSQKKITKPVLFQP